MGSWYADDMPHPGLVGQGSQNSLDPPLTSTAYADTRFPHRRAVCIERTSGHIEFYCKKLRVDT